MYLVEIIPIARGITREKLTYFSIEAPPIGSVVSIPLRNKKGKGIVSDIKNAREERSEIRSAEFEIKKIDTFSPKEIVPRSFSTIAQELATYYATTTGSVLWNLLPKTIIDNHTALPEFITSSTPSPIGHTRTVIVRAATEERISNYRAAIREHFAKTKSAYLCTPTIEDAEQLARELSRGIEGYTYILHSELPRKKLLETWLAIAAEPHPVLIIGTALFLCAPRQDIGLIVIERENSRAYRMQSRPYIDMRRVATTYAHHIGAKIMRGDIVVSTESWYSSQENEFGTIEYRDERSERTPKLSIVDMGTYKLEEKKPFRTISDELHELIKTTIRDKKRLFLFTPRKGLYPTTVCGDCGTVALCKKCSAPVVVHSGSTENEYLFVCHHCGTTRPTEERCQHCDSWKLAALGVGIERVFEDLQRDYPEASISILDKNTESTRARARKHIERFNETQGAILLGTEYALLYLTEIESSAAVSLDSLFLIPDFRMHERILGILATIQSKTRSNFLIQTRTPTHALFGHLAKKTFRDFYNSELEDRRNLKYPPFSLYIKITRKGKKENVEADIAELQRKLSDYDPLSYPGRIEKIRGTYIMHLLINLDPADWVDEDLRKKLASLPHHWTIQVDPDSLL